MSLEKFFIKPGIVAFRESETLLCAVLTYGVAVSVFDKVQKKGGLNFYLYPNSRLPVNKTPLFAMPSTLKLLQLFLNNGCERKNLEAHIFGGAYLSEEEDKMKMIAKENVRIANRVLEHNDVVIKSQDVGGLVGRKLIFNTLTGESIIAKVNKLREKDWSLEYVFEENPNNDISIF